MTHLETRIEAFRKLLSEHNLDTFMVAVKENRRYLSGFTGEDTQFDESAGTLFITADRLILATDSRYTAQASEEAPLYEVVCYQKGLAAELPSILKDLGTRRMGFEGMRISWEQYQKFIQALAKENLSVEMVKGDQVIAPLRLIKDAEEINIMRKALEIAESAFESLVQTLVPGMTEKEIAWAFEKQMREGGAESLSFHTIMASGPNSALPHATPGNRSIREKEPLLFDWGARLDGYCSDTTRTIFMGAPTDLTQRIFDLVLKANRAATTAIRPGASTKAIDVIARDIIREGGYGAYFGHGLGHGVGMAVHEPPRLSPLNETRLEPGMVLTVEPGIYLPGKTGVRLENMVLVTEDGVEVMNRLPLEM